MKVLHLLPALEQGGVETVVASLVRAGAACGWESVVASRGGRLVERILAEGGRHVALELKSKNPLTYFQRAHRLCGVLTVERPDLVCVHSRVPAWLFVRANRRLRLPWITYAHGANHVSRYSSVMTRGDLTVVPSRFLADYLRKNYALAEGKIRIVPPAVDGARFDPAGLDADFVSRKRREWRLGADDFVVMAVGRITAVKGYDTLIRSVARLAKTVPDVRLVFVGDADADHRGYLEGLVALAAREGVGDRVVFAGGESKVPECLSLASVVVSANVLKPESFGLSMAEALAMDRPVVAKAFGGALDIVEDGADGLLVRDGDFAAALARVRTMRFGGLRERALGRFGLSSLTERTRTVYADVLAGCRRR